MSDDRFHVCLPLVLKQECPHPEDWSNAHNFSNDAHDPGGETMCGITQREYDAYRKHNSLPVRGVRNLTREEGEDIYLNNYWLPECTKLPLGLDLQFFDEAVNCGPSAATKILQQTLDITSDGEWGPSTSLAVRGIFNVPRISSLFTVRREAYYRALRGYRYFGADWIRRSEEIGAEAEKMVG